MLLVFIIGQNSVGIDRYCSLAVTLRRLVGLYIYMRLHTSHCVKTFRHLQNQKYRTYRNAVSRVATGATVWHTGNLTTFQGLSTTFFEACSGNDVPH